MSPAPVGQRPTSLPVSSRSRPPAPYVIDGLGRRIAKTAGNGNLIQGFLWDGAHLVGETDATGAVIAHYFYLTRVNVPDFMVRKVSGVWQTFRLISDQAGSPKVLVQLSGGTPSVVERYDWDDWGVATATWPGTYHPFGFAGGIWDGSMGTYRFGAREYRPWEGRWWSKDASRFGGGLNFYVYADNDPVNYVDVDGKHPVAVAIAWGLVVLWFATQVPDHEAHSLGAMVTGVTMVGTAGASSLLAMSMEPVICGGASAAAGIEATSATNAALLRNQLTAEEIAGGHAFDKHVIQQAEFPGIVTALHQVWWKRGTA